MQVLSWIDICAGLAAKTVARGPVVTASVDTVHFLRPCHQGSVAIIAAMVNRVFQSSMEASTSAPFACPPVGLLHKSGVLPGSGACKSGWWRRKIGAHES